MKLIRSCTPNSKKARPASRAFPIYPVYIGYLKGVLDSVSSKYSTCVDPHQGARCRGGARNAGYGRLEDKSSNECRESDNQRSEREIINIYPQKATCAHRAIGARDVCDRSAHGEPALRCKPRCKMFSLPHSWPTGDRLRWLGVRSQSCCQRQPSIANLVLYCRTGRCARRGVLTNAIKSSLPNAPRPW